MMWNPAAASSTEQTAQSEVIKEVSIFILIRIWRRNKARRSLWKTQDTDHVSYPRPVSWATGEKTGRWTYFRLIVGPRLIISDQRYETLRLTVCPTRSESERYQEDWGWAYDNMWWGDIVSRRYIGWDRWRIKEAVISRFNVEFRGDIRLDK